MSQTFFVTHAQYVLLKLFSKPEDAYSKAEYGGKETVKPVVGEGYSKPARHNDHGEAIPEVVEVYFAVCVNHYDSRVQSCEQSGAEETRDETECSIEGKPVPNRGAPLSFELHERVTGEF